VRKNVLLPLLSLFVLFVIFQSQTAFSQSSDDIKKLNDDIKTLKEGQAAIQKDLQEIKKLIQQRLALQPEPQAKPEFKETIVDVHGWPAKGDEKAKLAMIEFSDYQ
jgi:peptidoglycan hydrolase CwlO-like protein